jgi:hypothetical protein
MSIYRGSRWNVDLSRIAGECRFTADRGRMSTYRESWKNVDPPRIAEEGRSTANRGIMSIYRGSRGNVDLPRIDIPPRFAVDRPPMAVHTKSCRQKVAVKILGVRVYRRVDWLDVQKVGVFSVGIVVSACSLIHRNHGGMGEPTAR